MGRSSMVISAIAVAIGAILYWNVTSQGTSVHFSTVGIILMIVGAYGFVVSTIIVIESRGLLRPGQHSAHRHVVDKQGYSRSLQGGSR